MWLPFRREFLSQKTRPERRREILSRVHPIEANKLLHQLRRRPYWPLLLLEDPTLGVRRG
jgi:hypothetical protein